MNIIRYIGRQFARPEGVGGKMSTWIMNRMNQKQYRCVEKLVEKRKPQQVLDIGFGNGQLLKKLYQKNKTKFSGIELSEDMLVQANKKNSKAVEEGSISLCIGSIINMPYEYNTFDFVYTVNTVYFWEDLERGYSEAVRVLKAGGVFANVFYTKKFLDKVRYTKYDFTKYSQDELMNKVKQMGFTKVKLIQIEEGNAYCLVVGK